MICLDTSFLIRALVSGSRQDRRLRQWLGAGEQLSISAVGWAEFLCGPVEPGHADLAARIVTQRLPFDEQDGALAARLFNEAGRRHGSLTDCMIAATVIRSDASLATANAGDFQRFSAAGLKTVVV